MAGGGARRDPVEDLAAAAWACWALPLLVTELVIQGRKILAVRAI